MKRVIRGIGIVIVGTLATVGEIGGISGCGDGDDDCLPSGNNCSAAYLEKNGKTGVPCCDNLRCCYLPNGITVPTCQPSYRCE
jgi:hypothetical protein